MIIVAVDGQPALPAGISLLEASHGHQGGPAPHTIIALMDAADEPATAAESWSGLLRMAATRIHSEDFVCEPAEYRH